MSYLTLYPVDHECLGEPRDPVQFKGTGILLGFLLDHGTIVHRSLDAGDGRQAGPSRARQIDKLIVIVDESVRGDFIDLNPDSCTTPYLGSVGNQIINYGLATAGANCSDSSNAILRYGPPPAEIGKQPYGTLLRVPIWQFAKAAGYRTAWIDGQAGGGFDNFIDLDEATGIDDHLYAASSVPLWQRDVVVLKMLKQALSSPEPQMIWINKNGAHFFYDFDYPANGARFTPVIGEDVGYTSDRGRLLNSYRNAIAWSVDDFFEGLHQFVDLRRTLIVYTSDHGQNLLEDGSVITHCRRENATAGEGVVPLFFMTEAQPLREQLMAGARLNFNGASHFQLFSTLIQIMGYDPAEVREPLFPDLFHRLPTSEPMGSSPARCMGRFGQAPAWKPHPTLAPEPAAQAGACAGAQPKAE